MGVLSAILGAKQALKDADSLMPVNRTSGNVVFDIARDFNPFEAISNFATKKEGSRLLKYLMKTFVLSDEDMKDVHDIAGRGAPFSLDEVALLSMAAGKDPSGYGLSEDEDADDSVIDGYAEHLRNYLYTYKPEAQELDPKIDPEEEHIGIMAQDLEQVNPACVKEINGVKTVDTNRLALMNAGAIGDLARRLDALEAKIGGR